MTAKEMFEKLGYAFKEDEQFIYYKNNKLVTYHIIFSKEYETVEITPTIDEEIHTFIRLSKKLLQAINKQIEELGWDNE